MVLFCALAVGLWKAGSSKLQPKPDVQGIIVDRWADYLESQYGSRPVFNLLIETDDKKRITVGVNADTYERARVGLYYKRRAGVSEITESAAGTPRIGK